MGNVKCEWWHIRINENDIGEPDKHGFRPLERRDEQYMLNLLQHKGYVVEAIYQLEHTNTTESYLSGHWQITMKVHKPCNRYQIRNMFNLKKKEYWAPVRDIEASKHYCSKTSTRIAGPFQFRKTTLLNALINP